jgi:hypothetical protein
MMEKVPSSIVGLRSRFKGWTEERGVCENRLNKSFQINGRYGDSGEHGK